MHKAVVMAGGQGSRLWPLTATRPKPLVRVANDPVLAYILEWLRSYGVSEVLLTLHYRADDIRRALGNGRSLGLQIDYRVEKEPLGTAGSVKAVEDWVAGEPFLIVSGDALTDLDLKGLIGRHQETGAWLTLGLKRVADPSVYGVVQLDQTGRVIRFQEKPGPGQAISDLANTGIYCVEPEVLQWVPRGQASDWSRDIFSQFVAGELPLYGHPVDGYWCDIGSLDDYRRGQYDVLEGAVRSDRLALAFYPGLRISPEAEVAFDAVIQGPVVVGAGCRIESEAQVLPGSVIGDRTIIRTGARVQGAIVGAGCEIGPGAVLRDCIIDDQVRIGAECTVSEGAVMGRGGRLDRGFHLGAGQRVGPGQRLPSPPAGVPSGEPALTAA
jgi:mannose-1-phosphate guanylyltransferase / phosphomannomutase